MEGRIVFVTKSEVEIMDDGYKWRKYGKKMVKNSPNPRYTYDLFHYMYVSLVNYTYVSSELYTEYRHDPGIQELINSLIKNNCNLKTCMITRTCRNYYKCSSGGCGVKKRVERDNNDSRYVITTYDGVHYHECPSVLYDHHQNNTNSEAWILQPSNSSTTSKLT